MGEGQPRPSSEARHRSLSSGDLGGRRAANLRPLWLQDRLSQDSTHRPLPHSPREARGPPGLPNPALPSQTLPTVPQRKFLQMLLQSTLPFRPEWRVVKRLTSKRPRCHSPQPIKKKKRLLMLKEPFISSHSPAGNLTVWGPFSKLPQMFCPGA